MRARVSWDYFMKRRNISYSALTGMEYDRYASWCHSRYVIPLDKDEFESNIAPFIQTPKKKVQKEVPVIPEPVIFTTKELNKKKKNDLVKLCDLYGIALNGKETKKLLVTLILDVNNE